MKKIIEKEATFCDHCGKEAYVETCLCCGVDHCYECRKTQGVEYEHGVGFSGNGDGYYCNECDTKLSKSKADPLYNAYHEIKTLRQKQRLWYAKFNAEVTAAEQRIKALIA